MAERELAILIKARDLASKTIKGVDKNLGNLGKRAEKGFGNAANNIGKLGVAAAGISLAGIAGSIKVAADFESQLNTINTVAQLSQRELTGVGDTIRKMARNSGADLSDLTSAYYDLVSAGIKPGADATAVLAQAQTLAVGGLATTSEAVDLLTSALNTYGMGAKDAGHVTDVFAGAIAAGKTTAADLASVFAQVGPIAAASGIEIEELGAAFGTMTAAGTKPAAVATNLKGALVKLQKPTSIMLKLQKELGVNFADMARDKGLAFTYGEIRKAADKAHIPLAQVLGDVEAQQYALGVTGTAAEKYGKNLADAQNKTGVAAEQAAERQKGLNFQIARLKALAIDAGITIGSKLLPKLTPLAEKAVAFFDTHQADVERFGDAIAEGFESAAKFAQKLPWEAIGSGLKSAAQWAERLMGVFMALPPEVQTTIIALAGLNKLSGGAIGGIVGELGKGLIKGVLGMTAGVVNLKAGVVNGGGMPGAAGAGAAAGASKASKAGALVGNLSKLIGVGLIAEMASEFSDEISGFGADLRKSIVGENFPTISAGDLEWPFGTKNTPTILPQLGGNGLFGGTAAPVSLGGPKVKGTFSKEDAAQAASLNRIDANTRALPPALEVSTARTVAAANATSDRIEASRMAAMASSAKIVAATASVSPALEVSTARQVAAENRTTDRIEASRMAGLSAAGRTTAAAARTRDAVAAAASAASGQAARVAAAAREAGYISKAGGTAAAAAIRAKDLSVTTNFNPIIKTYVSVRETINTRTTYRQYQKTAS